MNNLGLNKQLVEQFKKIKTPFYHYDMALLKKTIDIAYSEASKYNYHLHYALKANTNSEILNLISSYSIGADCVSGNEVKRALESGFNANDVVFAGVGKTDEEIAYALKNDIFCFNCESIQELEVINEIAYSKQRIARVALRINPNIDAHTHHYITTGTDDNKFGIYLQDLEEVVEAIKRLPYLQLIGIHLHVGSQITDNEVFRLLALKANELQNWFEAKGIELQNLNLGGGLGVDYENPDVIPDFAGYFRTISENLMMRLGQRVHFEPGRSLVAQCGTLITKALYIKKGQTTQFVIVDAGMNDLIRPALYQAVHKIENLTSDKDLQTYDVVGPVCESSDFFGKSVLLPECSRGDLISVRSAGAYGQVMASQYNLRQLAKAYYL